MKKCGVLGFPVSHSLSPAMHNAGFVALNLPFEYQFCEVAPEDLNCFMKRVKTAEFVGLSVTVPYKGTVIEYCDELTEQAKKIGAVNTLYFVGEKLVGDNTDWYGFSEAIGEVYTDLSQKSVLVIGAGGAARGVMYALQMAKANVFVVNRTPEKAAELAKEFGAKSILEDDLIGQNFDIVINTTSVGLKDEDPLPVSEQVVEQAELIFDIIYKNTKLLQLAKKLNKKFIDGKTMLLYQGLKQFEIFTGENPPREVMRNALK